MKKHHMLLVLGMLVAASAANADEAKPSVLPMTMPAGAGNGDAALPPGHPTAAPLATPADTNLTNSGKILEVLDAPPYSYLKVADKKGTIWLAGYKGDFTKGATVKYSSGIEMKNFHSKSLNRTFDSIIFVDSMQQAKK